MCIAVIGLGNMGLPMALNLIKAGHAVTGFDLREEPKAAVAKAGGTAAGNALTSVQDAEIALLMIVSGE